MREKSHPDMPIVLQSSIPENEKLAQESARVPAQGLAGAVAPAAGSSSRASASATSSSACRRRGDRPRGRPEDAGREAADVPAESLAYHGERNHFSNWLKARTEFALAESCAAQGRGLRDARGPARGSDPLDLDEYRRERDRSVVADFDRNASTELRAASRASAADRWAARPAVWPSSTGCSTRVARRRALSQDVRDLVPSSVVLGTDVFDQFLEQNDLRDFAIRPRATSEIEQRFLAAPFPEETDRDLEAFLEHATVPAGRALLGPARGLAAASPSPASTDLHAAQQRPRPRRMRLIQLLSAGQARLRLDLLAAGQGLPGHDALSPRGREDGGDHPARWSARTRQSRFYPDFSGVARSHNFYPDAAD